MEKVEITLLSGNSIVLLAEIRKSEGMGEDTLEEKIDSDLSTLNMKW